MGGLVAKGATEGVIWEGAAFLLLWLPRSLSGDVRVQCENPRAVFSCRDGVGNCVQGLRLPS